MNYMKPGESDPHNGMRHEAARARNLLRSTFALLRGNLTAMALLLCALSGPAFAAESIPSTNLHNAFVVTPKVLSGSSPDNEAGFAELAKLGVKTIISVDGAKPDVEAARKHGLRYVHLPVGYDGIPTNRVAELVRAAQTLDGPFYVHCHHGRHRGPAAVAVMCEAVSGWSTNLAERWLRLAGTSADYPGLYRNAREFKLPGATELAAVKELPEVAKTSSVVETMVAMDEHMERLKGAQKTGWKSVPGHPDIQPSHEATLMWEQFRELARLGDNRNRPAEYRAKLADAEQTVEQFRALLKQIPLDSPKAEDAFKKVGQSCTACHKQYRN